jgi:MoaA/NifB/PqqE/SkfB family radical SAM enzyme
VNVRRIENVLAVEAGFVARDDRAWGGPREAWIEVAARCNLRCVMCPITYDPRYQGGSGPELLTPDRFAALEPIFPTLHRAHLFGLGEPLLSPYLHDYARRLTAAGVEVWTTTNATLIGPAEAEELAAAGFRRISVSIDGATPETYERIRKHGLFADAVAGIRALGEVRRRRGSPELYLAMVAMASNLHELPALVDLAVEAGADGVHVSPLYSWDHPEIERFARAESLATLGDDAVQALVSEARGRAEARGLEFSSLIDLEAVAPASDNGGNGAHRVLGAEVLAGGGNGGGNGGHSSARLPWACSEPWSTVNVNARGQVRTCCFNDTVLGTLGGDEDEAAGIGTIWNGAPYRELRRDHLNLDAPPSCAGCVRAGRVKVSPYLPVLAREGKDFAGPAPLPGERPCQGAAAAGSRAAAESADGDLPIVVAPGDGEPCDGRVVVMGRLPRRPVPERLGRAIEAAFPDPEPVALPEIRVNGELVGRVADFGVTDHSQWAIAIELPFVTPGSHRLSVSAPASAGGEQWAERRLHVLGPPRREEPIVGDRLAFWLELTQPEPCPRLQIAGRRRRPTEWICGTYGDAWRGFALLDVSDLEPGAHAVDVALERHPARRIAFRRIAIARPGTASGGSAIHSRS